MRATIPVNTTPRKRHVSTTLEETDLFPDVRLPFERACKITDRKRAQLLRVMVDAWLSQWEAAGSPPDYLGYKRGAWDPRTWDPNTVTTYVRHGRALAEGKLADVVPFRPRLVPDLSAEEPEK